MTSAHYKMVFSLEQKIFIIESYFRNGTKVDGVWTYSIEECMEEFHNEYPNDVFVRQQFVETLKRCLTRFRESGNVAAKGGGRPKKRTDEAIAEVTGIMQNEPHTSVRHLSQQVHLSIGTCHTIVRQDAHLYPYRLTAIQELLPHDIPERLHFCQWFLDVLNNNQEALRKTFFTDEAWFYRQGYVNSQNFRTWSAENPHVFVETPLHPEKIGVWAAISARRLIGPIFFNGSINAERYREEILQPFFNELHDDELREGYFQQDGARPHCTAETLQLLRQFFDNRLISRNTEIPWPARSCDLTPCDFCLWPYIKNSIFQTPINNLEELRQRIIEKFEEINNMPQFLENAVNGIGNRVLKCIQSGGGHFNHLL